MIYSYECEQQVLAGLIKHPEVYPEIAPFVTEEDFFSESSIVNKTIFSVIRQAINLGEKIDEVIVSERVNSLGISFEDNLSVFDYINALSMRAVSKTSTLDTAKELKKYTVKRGLCKAASQIIEKVKSIPNTETYDSIIEASDEIYNENINMFQESSDSPENVFESMENVMEERGENPLQEFGLMGPHHSINNLYGSLLRPGNITVIVARSGVGKTQFCMDFCTKTSAKYENVPVLHFDNGEMSKDEIMNRQCAAISGVALNLIETGKWRMAGDEVVKKMRGALKKVKDMKFYYYNVGGMSVDGMINVIRRFYYAKVGRGNKMILSFDYIKTTFEKFNTKTEWQVVGEMVDKFKRVVQKEIVFEGEPMIAMMTSVQSNRSGIVGNRNSDAVTDDESVVSLSDRITQFSSHMFILRNKTMDELQNSPADSGSHRLTCVKHRHLGEDVYRALSPVEMPDGSKRKNYINLEIENFNIKDMGDLKDMADKMLLDDTSISDESGFFRAAPNL
jgi:replicative DNA helicase|tara:strand:+ start:7295 stop:8815 length:1521 start_codon:yes stop_codon:yes gene_type:complete